MALKTLRQAVCEFRKAHLKPLNSGIQKNLEKIIKPLHLFVELDSDFRMKLKYKGIPITLDQISSGTHDQLFFAYRLILSKMLSSAVSFPLIIDDAFVHFDPDRTKRIFRLLNELKNQHQIIVCSSNDQYIPMCDNVINIDEYLSNIDD